MARFLKWFGLIFALHIIFLVGYLGLHPEGDIPTDLYVFFYLLWPLFFIPTGVRHGGEFFFSPVTVFFYSLFFAAIITKWQNRRSLSK